MPDRIAEPEGSSVIAARPGCAVARAAAHAPIVRMLSDDDAAEIAKRPREPISPQVLG